MDASLKVCVSPEEGASAAALGSNLPLLIVLVVLLGVGCAGVLAVLAVYILLGSGVEYSTARSIQIVGDIAMLFEVTRSADWFANSELSPVFRIPFILILNPVRFRRSGHLLALLH